MTVRPKRGRAPWAPAVALLGLSVFSACSWKEGDGRSVAPDAGLESGGVGGAGAGGRSGGGGSGGARGGSGGRATGGVSSGGSGGVPSGGSGGSSAGGSIGNGGASLDGAADASTCSCPDGQYCGAGDICIPGCKLDGSGCASGRCDGNHECISCILDSECAAGHVCATGICLAACGNDGTCPTDDTCCVNRCADLARDHLHCGGCGVTCANTEFCAATGCLSAVLTNVCASPQATVLLDGLSVDDATAPIVRDGLVAGCGLPTSAAVVVDQSATDTLHHDLPGASDPLTGRPVVGSGNLQVVIGGPFGQTLIRYLETHGVTSVYNSFDAVRLRFHRRSVDGGADSLIVDALQSDVNETHSFFLIEMVVDPTTGTLMLALDGFNAKGTAVAAWFFLNQMLPNRSTLDKSFYVYEWTARPGDGGADPPPSSADTFRLVESGP